MGIFGSIGEGWGLFSDSFSFLLKKPIFLLPIFVSWLFFAGVVLYLRYYFTFPSSFLLSMLYLYLLIFLISFVICIANIVMLELMQQIETGDRISLGDALREALMNDVLKLIPVAMIWAMVWLIILIIKALTSKKKDRARAEPSSRDAARALGGADQPFSWIGLGLEMFEKLVRMVVFLTLPAIAWENKGPFSSFSKAFEIIKRHPIQFMTTYTLTGFAAFLMALPLLPIFLMDDLGITFSTTVWTIVIIYECIIWTLGIYLEQMSVGLLYLWHMKWIKNGSQGELSSVSKPDLLDKTYELQKA
jgi:hypothetical protein